MRTASITKKSVVRPGRQAVGFTLLELLIVISVIMVLMGLLIPAFYKVKDRAKANKRSIELRVIGSAIGLYKTQAGKFPAPNSDLTGGVDLSYGADDDGNPLEGGSNSQVMDILREAVPPVIDPNKLRWDGDGNIIDPYDKQYTIWLDLNYSELGEGYKVQ